MYKGDEMELGASQRLGKGDPAALVLATGARRTAPVAIAEEN